MTQNDLSINYAPAFCNALPPDYLLSPICGSETFPTGEGE